MALNCLVLGIETMATTPTYKELEVLSGKYGKVLYGGGKRKNKSVPYFDKLDSLHGLLSKYINSDGRNGGIFKYIEIYLFNEKSLLPLILLKYQNEYITSFVVDDLIIDKLTQLHMSRYQIKRDIDMLESIEISFGLYKKNNISDELLENNIQDLIKSIDVLSQKLDLTSKSLIDETEKIIKSGW
jgi:hypothetical protein